MKILALSDRVDPRIYSSFCKERFGDVDCIVSCGDLPEYYLDFVVSTLNVPLFFVHGNHDAPREQESLAGGTNLDERVICYRNVLIAGLEGCYWYNGNPHQYTEREMYWKYLRLLPRLLFARLKHGRYLDILVTHAPPKGVHEGQDPPHRGFATFTHILKKYRPRYHLHGHVHLYGSAQDVTTRFLDTLVVNCYGYQVIEIVPEKG
uniref:Calcineurin-like phosphoesterase domain-containing protein n=1 Tax=Candidatus Caldatribacterium californiense TaxID=1454726 RepID=A0A7V3YGL2_9BACT